MLVEITKMNLIPPVQSINVGVCSDDILRSDGGSEYPCLKAVSKTTATNVHHVCSSVTVNLVAAEMYDYH